MSKELTPLEALTELRKRFTDEFYYSFNNKECFLIIEEALEDYDLVCEMNSQLVGRNNELLSENLKLRKQLKEKE